MSRTDTRKKDEFGLERKTDRKQESPAMRCVPTEEPALLEEWLGLTLYCISSDPRQ